jgi:hypothetical protein
MRKHTSLKRAKKKEANENEKKKPKRTVTCILRFRCLLFWNVRLYSLCSAGCSSKVEFHCLFWGKNGDKESFFCYSEFINKTRQSYLNYRSGMKLKKFRCFSIKIHNLFFKNSQLQQFSMVEVLLSNIIS